MPLIRYNERSWAIDVISEINLYIANKKWHFKSAGGESTIQGEKSSLFPDVLIFKDVSREIILHGWELKLPDTPINDSELLKNAILKANILHRNSFILWNVKSAVLYVKKGDTFSIRKTWMDINVNSRAEVRPKEELWKKLLHSILEDLNSFFEKGEITEGSTYEILDVDAIIDIVLENISTTAENLKRKTRKNSKLDAEINHWWLSSATEYGYNPTSDEGKNNKYPTLSKVILTDWVFKIVFANIIKRHFNQACIIENINFDSSISNAKKIISEISEHCNFWNIFSDNLAIDEISDTAWNQVVQLNQFLSTINLKGIEIETLHNLLQNSIASAKRKVAGQFSTPKGLAELLVRLTIENKEGIVIDPCCGTGTIIHEAFLLKKEYEIPEDEIFNSIWASDKHSFPLQLSTLTFARPENLGKILNVFREDVMDMKAGQKISFRNPNNGKKIVKELPKFNYIVSNLPFIKSKEINVLNPSIKLINDFISDEVQSKMVLSGKSDIFAYIPFYLTQIMEENGKIGLILSNAWLGTEYGEIFIELLQKFFDIEFVVISGKGKWFHNADVITTLLIASKKITTIQSSMKGEIAFCTLNSKIEDIADIKQLSENILLKRDTNQLTTQIYTNTKITQLEEIGIPWCGYFANLDWITQISNKLVRCSHFFDFTRGERRGWNPLFYPAKGHNIERDYIKPVLKNLRSTSGLTCIADSEAFCCSKSQKELKHLKHAGALNWIKVFENQTNEIGVPLKESLHRANMFWYEMKTNNLANFVANVNYDKSLFIAAFEESSFIDQRMIGLSTKPKFRDENKILFLALFNSMLSMFFIESFGFGRGLGALDLRATKFERDFQILNPELLSANQKQEIVDSFRPILNRNRLPLEQEILNADRVHFEQVLFRSFGITSHFKAIKKSLLHLYRIRFAINSN